MFNLQGSEIIVILLLALVVLGPDKLPDAVRRFSKTYSELKKMGSGFQTELKSAIDEPMREMRETAQMVRDAADPAKLAREAEAEAEAEALAERRLAAESPELTKAIEETVTDDAPSFADDVPSFEGVDDPGSGLVATPGDAPDDKRTPDDISIEKPDEATSA